MMLLIEEHLCAVGKSLPFGLLLEGLVGVCTLGSSSSVMVTVIDGLLSASGRSLKEVGKAWVYSCW